MKKVDEQQVDFSGIKNTVFALCPLEDHEWKAFSDKLKVKKLEKGDYLTGLGIAFSLSAE